MPRIYVNFGVQHDTPYTIVPSFYYKILSIEVNINIQVSIKSEKRFKLMSRIYSLLYLFCS